MKSLCIWGNSGLVTLGESLHLCTSVPSPRLSVHCVCMHGVMSSGQGLAPRDGV